MIRNDDKKWFHSVTEQSCQHEPLPADPRLVSRRPFINQPQRIFGQSNNNFRDRMRSVQFCSFQWKRYIPFNQLQLTVGMRVLFAFTYFSSSLYICHAFTIPNLFNWVLDFIDHNEINESSQNRDPRGQSRRGGYQSLNTLSDYQQSEAHHYTEDGPFDVTEHILPVFLIAFCASIVNSLFLFESGI